MNMDRNERQEQPSVSRGQSHQPTKSRMVRKATRTVIRNDGQRPDVEREGQKVLLNENEIKIATWNVGSMSGRSGEVVNVMRRRKIDICCIQESRWRGSSARWMGNSGSRYKFFWQGQSDGTGGVGVLVSEPLVKQMVNIKRHNERILILKVLIDKQLINVISVYAPQTGRSTEEKMLFWDEMHDVLSSISSSEMVILGGDLNGHVGADSTGYEGVHGGMGFGSRNQEGEYILEFADALELAVCNTFFCKSASHLVTYQSGNNQTQIDYVLVRQTERRLVRDVKVIAGEECVPQQKLVCASIIIKKSEKLKRRKYVPRLKVWKLKNESHKSKFETFVKSKSEHVRQAEKEPEHLWKEMKEVLLEATETVCGRTRGRPSHRETWWWSDEVDEAVRLKRTAFTKWKSSGRCEDKEVYQEAKRKARRTVWEAQEMKRRELTDELCQATKHDIFRIAKRMAKDCSDNTTPKCIRDATGTVVYGEEVQQVWKEYMESLLNEEYEWNRDLTCEPVEGPRCILTCDEYKEALIASKCDKAAGPSTVVSEMLVAAGSVGISWLTELGNSILDRRTIPKDWTISTLVPLFKGKGDPLQCSSYRAIKLLDQVMKIHERVLEKRIREIVDLKNLQFGFMPGRSTTDAIFILRQLQEKYLAYDRELFFGFLDLEKAFDRVPRSVVQWALRKAGVDEWLVSAVMTLFNEARSEVLTEVGRTDSFEVKVGLHQGSVLSPLLFVIVMDAISRDSEAALPWDLLYADDLAIIAETKEKLVERISVWKKCLAEKGLRVNPSKSKVLVSSIHTTEESNAAKYPCAVCRRGVGSNSIRCNECLQWVHRKCSGIVGNLQRASSTFKCRLCSCQTTRNPQISSLMVDGHQLEVVSSFCYLGDEIHAGGGADFAVNRRIRCGWAIFKALLPFLTSRAPSLKMKGKVYDACVRKGMLYGSETWALKLESEERLQRVEMRMLRWMLGISLKDRKRNEEIRTMFNIDPISDVVKKNRLRWYGHVMRRDPEECVQKVMGWKIEEKRRKGRPRKTWCDTIAADLKLLGLKANDVHDRLRWRSSIQSIGKTRPTLRSGRNGR